MALWDWLTPLLMICVSALVLIFAPLLAAGQVSGTNALIAGLVVLVAATVQTILAVAVAVGCAFVFNIGFDAFGRGTLRLAAISLTASAVTQVVGQVIGCFSIFVYVGLVVIMLQTMLDLDGGEAMLFAVVFIVVQIAATFALAGVIASFS